MMHPQTAVGRQRKIWGLHPNVFFLGLTSLLTDVSSELVFTLVPLFLANVLGTGTATIGLIGGLSDSTEAVFRIFSGRLSDKINRPKLLAVCGYSLATIVKPFMYIAGSWGAVTGIRLGDRVGKGIRSAPRDALLADSLSAGERGRGFGLRQAMDTTGAVLGLAIAATVIYSVQGGGIALSLKSYQRLVLAGIVPAVLAVLVLLFFVRERQRRPQRAGQQPGVPLFTLRNGFDVRFNIFLAITVLFMLGNSSDFFVILRAQNLNVPLIQVITMLVLFNVTYAVSALPMGILSDRLGRKRIIILGWSIYAIIYLGFALATSTWHSWLLFAGYGLYYGAFEGVGRAFIADLVPEEKRGTAYGLYHGVVSFALLPASLIAGLLWDTVNPRAPFFFGAGLAFLAMLAIAILIREPRAPSKLD